MINKHRFFHAILMIKERMNAHLFNLDTLERDLKDLPGRLPDGVDKNLRENIIQSDIRTYRAAIANAKEAIEILEKTANGEISDGYHTFNELYKHRNWLFINFCYMCQLYHHNTVYRYKTEEGWFVLMVTASNDKVQMSYHLPIDLWEYCDFALDDATASKIFNGHNSADVLAILMMLKR